jgi:protocatechuate 3,4-dioxygenase beta subunit
VFFPGVPTESSATTISLNAGEERTGVDIQLQLVPTATISGTIAMSDGGVLPNAQVILLAHDRIEGLAFSGFSATSAVNGKFTFTGLMPGRYTITARPSNSPALARGGGPPLGADVLAQFALTEVTVEGQDVVADLRLQTGAIVAGRLAFAGAAPPPADLSKVRLSMSAIVSRSEAAIGVAPATVDATGAFEFASVAPGRYRMSASVPGSTATTGWQVLGAMKDGRDVLDLPLEVGSAPVRNIVVTFTDHGAELSGTILDATGHPAPEYFIVVFSSDRAFWTPQSRRIQAKRPANDGRFTFTNLPPGNYQVAAVTDVEQGEWFDPSFLAALAPASIKLTIAEGEKKTQDIQVAAGR